MGSRKRNYVPKHYSGSEKKFKWYIDYKGFVPKINYPKFSEKLQELQRNVNQKSTLRCICKLFNFIKLFNKFKKT